MGNSKSRRNKGAGTFFESQKEQERNKSQLKGQLKAKPQKQQKASKNVPSEAEPKSVKDALHTHVTQSYDEEIIGIMKHQINNDPDSFILNQLLLSVQFFENYERVIFDLKNNSITQSDVKLNEDMAQHQKHVFLPDKLLESVDTYIKFQNRYEDMDKSIPTDRPKKTLDEYKKPSPNKPEPLQAQRMFVVHDNIEVNHPEDISDYSTVIGAPFYKMLLDKCDESGYVKLKKLEILQNNRENGIKSTFESEAKSSDSEVDSVISDTPNAILEEDDDVNDNDDNDDDDDEPTKNNFMEILKNKVEQKPKSFYKTPENVRKADIRFEKKEPSSDSSEIVKERRPSGILKNTNSAVLKGKLIHTEIKPKKTKEREDYKNSASGSESSGYKSSHSPLTDYNGNESDYGYTTITAETTPKRLEMSQTAKFSDSTSEIPNRCISTVEVKKTCGNSEDDEIEDAYDSRYGNFQRELYKKLYYLNSNMFMMSFTDLFLMKLAHSLGFTPDNIKQALTQGASIYCNVNKGQFSTSYEVLPAINSTWPSVATEWLSRHRKPISSPRTKFIYQWPTPHMISKSQGLGCIIVPLGFRPTRGTNIEKGLQWKLTFPAVERYLETCMAHSQIRCYIFTLVLFKTFVRLESSQMGLDNTHIKNHLFWQLEKNFASWPEDRLGEALIIFLTSFYQHLRKGIMPNFFIKDCNTIKGIPKSVLLKQQRKLADISENPVMHVLAALRNIKYLKSEYYPKLNYRRLYSILTHPNCLLLINPQLALPDEVQVTEDNDGFGKPTPFWQNIKTDPEYNWRVNKQRQIEARKAAKSLVSNKVISSNYINRKKKPLEMEPNRRLLVLQLFIPHFLSMAEWSVKFEALKQGLIYLEHANRLSVLLQGTPGGEVLARDYQATIRENIDSIRSKITKPGAPRVPKRNESFNSTATPGTSGIRNTFNDQYRNTNNAHVEMNRPEPSSPTIKLINTISADIHTEISRPKFYQTVSFKDLDEESENSDDGLQESKL